jgi:SWI/SNF-related matrix-associated actin-dependent regulator of chromatin subfamily A3
VEERVLGIQDEKRRLMSLAFAEKDSDKKKKKAAGAGVQDLMRLLGQSSQSQSQVCTQP